MISVTYIYRLLCNPHSFQKIVHQLQEMTTRSIEVSFCFEKVLEIFIKWSSIQTACWLKILPAYNIVRLIPIIIVTYCCRVVHMCGGTVNMRPVRPIERQRMRPWLENLLNSKSVEGLRWTNKEEKIFEIPWRHGSRHGYSPQKDADLFARWAIHTGMWTYIFVWTGERLIQYGIPNWVRPPFSTCKTSSSWSKLKKGGTYIF